ncbi:MULTISPECIES: hypothetical protein [unclassified Brachybacterium]|uniref:hypothetical protein n=1 Tax=unclassified Brachybacterium TaxID=2623841 RepID=UPI000C80FDC9|nr:MULTISPECIES: hypothetical protein [unclassified Brachybacterium]PMC75743.1 hypothetical protein CJ197_05970 [Brachybacterium sp. UMB0905]
MNRPQPPEPSARNEEHQSPTVSPLVVPLLMLGLTIGFFTGYFLLLWGLLVVAAVIALAVAVVLRGGDREGMLALVAGTALAFLAVMLLAVFRRAF